MVASLLSNSQTHCWLRFSIIFLPHKMRRRSIILVVVGVELLLVTPEVSTFIISTVALSAAPSVRTPCRHTGKSRLSSLIPLSVDDLETLIATGAPTAAQYSTYFGRTSQERYARILESSIVSFLGVFFSYFLSFVMGGFVATLFGTLFLFWGILSPQLKAAQRNWEFYGGRPLVDLQDTVDTRDPDHAGLYGALFLGKIKDACVVQDATDAQEYELREFSDYRMERDELERFTGQPYLLRVECADQTGRTLQVHARMSEEYLEIRRGMPVTGVLLSTSPRFTTLAALTDLYVPDAQCWIGDYPYLDRAEVEELLATDDEIWNSLQGEGGVDELEDIPRKVDIVGATEKLRDEGSEPNQYYGRL